VNRLNQEIARAVNEPEVKEKLFEIGIDSVGSSPEELAQVMTAEVAKWGKLIKDAGIRSH
jgi:tripartite-type tricarboxylate transporter receptor subunit TctC